VALDASPPSQAALDAAVRLAAATGATLEGVFVEDADVLRAAALPAAYEVRSYRAAPRRMTAARLRRQLRQQAERARAALRRAARQFEVEHAFRVAEGRVAEALLKAARDADLLSLGRTSGHRASRRRLGRTARAVVEQAQGSVLLLRQALAPEHPVLVYYDGTPEAERALTLAAHLAVRDAASLLTVLVPARDATEARRLRSGLVDRLGSRISRLTIRPLTRLEAGRLADVAHHEGRGLVVVPADVPALRDDALRRFLTDVDRPVLVVR
jgi:nucleotide-binding universal stress UspA family protein